MWKRKQALNDGVTAFDEEGVQSLSDLAGSVKFIIETAEIEK